MSINVSTANDRGSPTEPELLDPEIAFQLSARIRDKKTIEVQYIIAPGYYLYRERFAFEVNGTAIGMPMIPRGKRKFDATFNQTMETHRKQVTIMLPLVADGPGAIVLKATSQGCADAGVCYPPLGQVVSLAGGSSAAVMAEPDSAIGFKTTVPVLNPARVGSAAALTTEGTFLRVTSSNEFDRQKKMAGRISLLDFYADWCAPCRQMEQVTFADARVKAKLAHFAMFQVDVTRNTVDDKLFLKRYKLVGPPGIVFFDKAGQEIPGSRVIGFEPPEKFLKTLERARQAP